MICEESDNNVEAESGNLRMGLSRAVLPTSCKVAANDGDIAGGVRQ